jgi:hypothetical protein
VPTTATLTTAVNSAVPSGTSTLDGVAPTNTLELGQGGTTPVPPAGGPAQPSPNPCEVANCQGINSILTGTIIIIVRRP